MARKQKTMRFGTAVLQNPLLVQAVGLTPVIVAATTLRAALWVCLLCVLHLLLCEALASLCLKKFPDWLRIAIYFTLGIFVMFPVAFYMESTDAAGLTSLRAILPLMSLNTLAVIRCERFAIFHTVKESLRDAAANAIGFSVATILVGFVRELLGGGTMFSGTPFERNVLGDNSLLVFILPPGAFIVLGYLVMVFNVVEIKTIWKWVVKIIAKIG